MSIALQASSVTMAKMYKVMDPLQPGTSTQCLTTDTSEVLHCPAESKRDMHGAGYKTIADHLVGFSKISCLPRTMNLLCFDDGEGIEATMCCIKPSGTTHVDSNITKPNYSTQRRGRDP